jgi:hypothetical protein
MSMTQLKLIADELKNDSSFTFSALNLNDYESALQTTPNDHKMIDSS